MSINRELFIEYKVKHDAAIKEEIINRNTGLVRSIVNELYRKRADLTYNDIVQEGLVGLLIAFDRFDLERDIEFTTYASYYIKMRIKQAYKNTLIRVPAYVYGIKDPKNKYVQIMEKVKFIKYNLFDVKSRLSKEEITINMNNLDDKESFIINKHFGLNGNEQLTFKEIGKLLNISREWIRKIEIKALKKLRTINNSNNH